MGLLGNAWHLPQDPQPSGFGGMRSPAGPVVAGTALTIVSGNQFQGEGNPANQLQDGSLVRYRRAGDPAWTDAPLSWFRTEGNDKFFRAALDLDGWGVGTAVEYYLVIAYDDRDQTFLFGDDTTSRSTGDETTAQDQPFRTVLADPAQLGRWGPPLDLGVVGIHAHLLPTGSVLLWGRRDAPGLTLDEHSCQPKLWDPASGEVRATQDQPTSLDGGGINLFCSGHAFLPDGRLLVVGGHLQDGFGLEQACTYDPFADRWQAQAAMNDGRWYPTAITLPDGTVLVTSGTHDGNQNNAQPQIFDDGGWRDPPRFPADLTPYPTEHLVPGGGVFFSGSLAHSWTLDTSVGGGWLEVETRRTVGRDYAPAVSYDDRHVLLLGGSANPAGPPSDLAQTIDLTAPAAGWTDLTPPMPRPRRQHNATLLPDGSVLVTGGTSGPGFNNLDRGQPVHAAVLWRPDGSWTPLAAESVDRCYHSTALLLPDGRVLSAGGGEYKPIDGDPRANDPQDTHADAQVFSPPYLFAGPQPEISAAPAQIHYGEAFTVGSPQAARIERATLIRLSSVTHTNNMNQRINELVVEQTPEGLRLTPPASADLCPPGHYLLFLLDGAGVPSVAHLLSISAAPGAVQPLRRVLDVIAEAVPHRHPSFAQPRPSPEEGRGRLVTVGITGLCPYGIGPCWGRASEALWQLPDVFAVASAPDTATSTATIELTDRSLPPVAAWAEEFAALVAGNYQLRGVEVTLVGTTIGPARLQEDDSGAEVSLAPSTPARVVASRAGSGGVLDLSPPDRDVLEELALLPSGSHVRATGRLEQRAGEYGLEVRTFTRVAT